MVMGKDYAWKLLNDLTSYTLEEVKALPYSRYFARKVWGLTIVCGVIVVSLVIMVNDTGGSIDITAILPGMLTVLALALIGLYFYYIPDKRTVYIARITGTTTDNSKVVFSYTGPRNPAETTLLQILADAKHIVTYVGRIREGTIYHVKIREF